MRNCIYSKLYNKYLTNKRVSILWQARLFPNKHYDTNSVKIYPHLENYNKKTRGSGFFCGTRCTFEKWHRNCSFV